MGEIFTVETQRAKQSVDITDQVIDAVRASGGSGGFCHVMTLHSTAAVVVNETNDPNIGIDLLDALDRAIPDRADYLHDRIDDNAQAHIKAAILGPSELVPLHRGELLLGTWQRIMLIEFDGPRKRRVSVQLLAPSG
jgi:secondary thiamine-phosphate synthase enzyme